jgi:hypothetical protein
MIGSAFGPLAKEANVFKGGAKGAFRQRFANVC